MREPRAARRTRQDADIPPNVKVTVGEIEESPTKIVKVVRQKLNGHDLVSCIVFCSGRRPGTGAEGLHLHLDQCREIIPLLQKALSVNITDS